MSQLAFQALRPGTTEASLTSYEGRSAIEVTLGGSPEPLPITREDGERLAYAARMAREKHRPLVVYVSSSGAGQNEGHEALHAWGRAARELALASGEIPVIAVLTGAAVAGPSFLLGLADIAIFTRGSYAYLSGPRMVQQFTGVPVSPETLGGSGVHAQTSGVASFVASDVEAARDLVADLLHLLPTSASELPPRAETDDDPARLIPHIADLLPDTPTGSYDIRDVIAEIVDDGALLELRGGWAQNLVTGLATMDGHTVGIVANQPQALAGTLDILASQKGARFVTFCDAFAIPLITLVDTPGFYPGKDLEWRGMIRHGAELAFAYARATVPRINVTLRKSYGGAYIVMDSKYMGNDLALAWPAAEIAVMGAKGAVEIMHRRVDPSERPALEADYEARLLNPYVAAERGSVDKVIDPSQTRVEVIAGLEMLLSKREELPRRKHGNTPL